jgi:transposase
MRLPPSVIIRQSTIALLDIFGGRTYRETEEMVQANLRIRELLDLKVTPHYSRLQKFYERIGKSIILKVFKVVLKRLKKALATGPRALIDSTGYHTTQASPHYLDCG